MTASGRPAPDHTLDTSGLVCPLPIIKTADAMRGVAGGEVLLVISTDFGILDDIPAWCTSNRQELLGIDEIPGEAGPVYHAYLRRR